MPCLFPLLPDLASIFESSVTGIANSSCSTVASAESLGFFESGSSKMSSDSLLRSLFHRMKSLTYPFFKKKLTNSHDNFAMAGRFSDLFQNCNKKSTRILKMWIYSNTIGVSQKWGHFQTESIKNTYQRGRFNVSTFLGGQCPSDILAFKASSKDELMNSS